MGSGSEKEVSAFVERLASRLKDDPKAPLSGRHQAAFIAVRPLVEGALERGFTMKATWEALRAEQKLSMTYETFREHCRRLRGGKRGAARRAQAASGGGAPVTAPTPRVEPAGSSETARARGFQHDRVPKKDEIY